VDPGILQTLLTERYPQLMSRLTMPSAYRGVLEITKSFYNFDELQKF